MSILVTGGAGYIGSHTAKALAAAGLHPVVYDSLSQGRRDFVRWGPLVHADLHDAAALDGAFVMHRPSAVIHFAGRILAGESIERPALYQRDNVDATRMLLDAMRRHDVRELIYSSSAAVYAPSAAARIPESAPLAPTTPYGANKVAAEAAIRAHSVAHGLRWVAFRYFNAAGADLDGDLGEAHDPETHAVPLAVEAALAATPFRIRGVDYDTPDGTAVRDYVHVQDLAAAHIEALRYLAAGGESGPFNLGADHGTSVRQLIETVSRLSGQRISTVAANRRPGDVATLVADSSAARQRGLWRPRFSDIDMIVRSAHRWHLREHERVKRAGDGSQNRNG